MKRNRDMVLLPWLLLALAVPVLAGCAGTAYRPDDVTQYVWPDAPQRPRVRMVGYIWSDLDVRQQGSSELLFGMEDIFTFKKPHRIVKDRAGRLFISDTIAHTVYVVDRQKGEISELFAPKGWGTPGGLALDEANGLLAATSGSSIFLFDLETLKFKAEIARGSFQRPSALAFDPARKILYVGDPRLNEVLALTYEGRPIRTVADSGLKPGQVYWPSGLDTDAEGNVYVVDSMNFRVQIFGPDGSFSGTFGSHGTSVGNFARPKDVAVSKDGLILVTDAAFGNFQIFDREGNLYLYVAQVGRTLNSLTTPQGIFIDDEDTIYVVDQGNGFIKMYQLYTDRWYDEHPDEAAKYPADSPRPRVDVGGPAREEEAAPEGVAETETEKPSIDPEELQRGW